MDITEADLRALGYERGGTVRPDPRPLRCKNPGAAREQWEGLFRVDITRDLSGFALYVIVADGEFKKAGHTGKGGTRFKIRMESSFNCVRPVIAAGPPYQGDFPWKHRVPLALLAGQEVELWVKEATADATEAAELNRRYRGEWTREGWTDGGRKRLVAAPTASAPQAARPQGALGDPPPQIPPVASVHSVQNPWQSLPAGSYVAPGDAPHVQRVNQVSSPEFVLHTELPPVPFIGDPRTADLIVLAKNPGYAGTEAAELDQFPTLTRLSLDALTFASTPPFFYLSASLRGTAGHTWWSARLRDLFAACKARGVEQDAVIARIACVEWFPYHSKRFRPLNAILPSQHYAFGLVRQAVERGATFVFLFGDGNEKLWRTHVPTLPADCIRLNSSQQTTLSGNNMKPHDFERIVAAVTSRRRGAG
jgi:hypothetical protein